MKKVVILETKLDQELSAMPDPSLKTVVVLLLVLVVFLPAAIMAQTCRVPDLPVINGTTDTSNNNASYLYTFGDCIGTVTEYEYCYSHVTIQRRQGLETVFDLLILEDLGGQYRVTDRRNMAGRAAESLNDCLDRDSFGNCCERVELEPPIIVTSNHLYGLRIRSRVHNLLLSLGSTSPGYIVPSFTDGRLKESNTLSEEELHISGDPEPIPDRSFRFIIQSESPVQDELTGCPAGQYASADGTCLNCPANSNNIGPVTECPCLEGFHRAGTDDPGDPCTTPPSAPQNLIVLGVNATSVYLTWEPPESNGGRDDIEYELSYQRSDESEGRIVYGRVNTTEGEITGLTPSTEYVVFVSAENGVSSQVPDTTGRTANTTVTTEETDNSTSTSDMALIIGATSTGAVAVLLLFVVVCCISKKQWKHSLKQTHLTFYEVESAPASTRISSLAFQLSQFLPHQMIVDINCIKLLESIGEGEFGIVYKAHFKRRESTERKVVAVKTLKGLFTVHDLQNITEEIMKMQQLDHPNVMTLLGVCFNNNSAPCIIMPYMANGSLLSYIRRQKGTLVLPEDTDNTQIERVQTVLLKTCIEITKGMAYLTKLKFVHRDLAARNCMIDHNGSIKVADFGLAENVYTRTYFRQDSDTPVMVPFKWMPPESLEEGVFSEKSDVWSFGITCWEVFTAGKTPYAAVGGREVLKLLKQGERLEKPENSACSQVIYSALMLQCWDDDPSKRPSFAELVSTLSTMLESTAGYLDLGVFIQEWQETSPRD